MYTDKWRLTLGNRRKPHSSQEAHNSGSKTVTALGKLWLFSGFLTAEKGLLLACFGITTPGPQVCTVRLRESPLTRHCSTTSGWFTFQGRVCGFHQIPRGLHSPQRLRPLAQGVVPRGVTESLSFHSSAEGDETTLRGTDKNPHAHYPVLYVRLPPQGHASEVEQFDVPVVVASTDNSLLLIVSIACRSRHAISDLSKC